MIIYIIPYIYICRVALSPRALRGRAERLASAGLDSRCISPAPHAPASRPACRHADLVVRRRRRCCELGRNHLLMQVCGDRLPVPPRWLVGVVLSSIPRRAVCSVSTVPSHVAGAFLSSTPSLSDPCARGRPARALPARRRLCCEWLARNRLGLSRADPTRAIPLRSARRSKFQFRSLRFFDALQKITSTSTITSREPVFGFDFSSDELPSAARAPR